MLNRLIHVLGPWLIGLSLALAQPGAPAVPDAHPPQTGEAPVVFGGKVLFTIATRVGSFSPVDRARAITAIVPGPAETQLPNVVCHDSRGARYLLDHLSGQHGFHVLLSPPRG